MKTNKISYIILFAGLSLLSFVIIQRAFADISDVQFPVAELGNCKSETDCRNYCDKPENTPACLNFAEKNNLMDKSEIETARKFVASGNKGPGGCTSKDSCETYCNDISHIDECVSFAEDNGLIPEEELKEARKVRDAIKRGVKPPACTSKKQCDSYCESSEHMEECINFAVEADLMSGEEKENSQKMLQAVKRGIKPPPCRGKEVCDQYCQQPDNMEACMSFAVEAGFMPEAERENAQKMLSAIKKGVKPPNCRGKEECDAYCQSDEHFEECANFAEAAGFMDAKDAEMARKTKGKGPGGCKGKEECESFCNNQANQEICFKFAEDNGMIPEEELKKMKEGMGRMREDVNRMPSEAKDCLKSALGEETMNKIQSGELTPGPQLGNAIQDCFQKMPRSSEGEIRERGDRIPPPPGEQGRERGEFRQGPGGCSTPEECQSFCSQNPEQCRNFSQPGEGQDRFEPGENRKPREPEMRQQPGAMPRPQPGTEEFEEFKKFERREGENQMPPKDGVPIEFRQEQIPQDQMMPPVEQAPPPPPPSEPAPAPEPAPSSFLNNQYLGAVARFLFGNR